MLFNSLEFWIFFAGITFIYFACPPRFRWAILLAASYFFYACWKVTWVLMLIFSTIVTYYAALRIEQAGNKNRKTAFLCLALIVNLGALGFFKYFNFFNESFRSLFTALGIGYGIPYLEILWPVGISFFTFQAAGYCIEVYRGKAPAERHLGIFALYMAFFPKLIAGPIERAGGLLAQLQKKCKIDLDRISSGIALVTLGIFKKVVIADRLAIYVDKVFSNPHDYWGQTLILASYFFTLQIYCDFSGYTDIARGCSRILGFELMENFNFPYLARSIADFWRRWHISLTSWFRDYLYIPLGGNRVSAPRWRVNILVVFLVSGLWHGANWTFVIWGGLHGFFYLFGKATEALRGQIRSALKIKGTLLAIFQTLLTFHLVCFAWIFFRSGSFGDAVYVVSHLFSGIADPIYWGPSKFTTVLTAFLAMAFILLEILHYLWTAKRPVPFRSIPFAVKCPAYCAALITIFLLGVSRTEFIYFHF